jgi:CDP-4-dehydro-6-deoxyglucose reductase, E3
MFKIKLKNSISFLCSEDDTILKGAERENKYLNYSCKVGRCKSCKAKVIKGSSIAVAEENVLTSKEKKDGYVLTCVRKPTSDLSLDIEDLSAYAFEPIKIFPSKVDAITKLSDNVIELKLRVPLQSRFNYLPGQYINIIKGDYKRSYSIANIDSSTGIVLFIKNYQGGKFSTYLFNEAKINDLMRVEGPLGTFFFRHTKKTNIVFLATGTGIAPIKAILESLDQNNLEIIGKNIYLFFGARTNKDLFWEPKFQNIDVIYVPVLSRSLNNWNGEKGHIQEVLISKKIDMKDSVVYACGSVNMIKDAKELAIENGLPEEFFYSDEFISSC